LNCLRFEQRRTKDQVALKVSDTASFLCLLAHKNRMKYHRKRIGPTLLVITAFLSEVIPIKANNHSPQPPSCSAPSKWFLMHGDAKTFVSGE
jgi:hypothetical protein